MTQADQLASLNEIFDFWAQQKQREYVLGGLGFL